MSSQHTVIVGGSSGIGLATARRLLAAGEKVTITGRDERRLDRAARELGSGVSTMTMDASAADTLPGCFERLGRFDHLVLALGSSRGVGPFATIDLAEVRAGFEEKVYAHFATAQAALAFLNLGGSITFVSGIPPQTALPGTTGIAAANAAISALVPILAVELKPLRVNAVAPGVIDTPWWDRFPEENKQAALAELAAKTPLRRVGQADDVAQAIAFLITNTFMTGHVLTCDGGFHLTASSP